MVVNQGPAVSAFFKTGDDDRDGCSERGDENDDYGDDE